MKTVSLLTLHRTGNYGSVLQALATQLVLEDMGFDVTVVDYYPNRNKISSMLKGLKAKKPLFERNPLALAAARAILLPSYLKRRRTFDRFIESNLNLSEHTYWNTSDFANHPLAADYYVTGSDQVWNSAWNGGIDEILFLSFTSDDACRLSFSSSFGKESLEEGEKARTRQLLERYRHVTVREDSGVRIAHSLGIENARQVLDPTLLLSSDDWERYCSDARPKGDYILMYNINHNKRLDRFAQSLSKRQGLPVYYVSYQLHDVFKRGHMRCCVPVGDFLSRVRTARYVICDSFHCAAYSVNFNREFAIIMPERFGTRLSSFARIMGLEDRIVPENGLEVFDKPIDWNEVNGRLSLERARSLEAIHEIFDN